MTAQEVKKVTKPVRKAADKPRRKPSGTQTAAALDTVDKPVVPVVAVPENAGPLSVSDALAKLLETSPQKLIVVSLNKDTQIAMVSAGEIDTATAIVLLSNALATVYGEMGAEAHKEIPVSTFLNNVNNVVSKRVMLTHPNAPLFSPINMDKPKHESEPGSTGTDPAN